MEVRMEWLFLLIAGSLEVTWSGFIKASDGFSKSTPSIITGIGYIASAVFLALALRKLPLGTAYAMWTGFGILGTTILGTMLFKETVTLPQAGCIIMIAAGIMGLKLLA